MAGLLNIKTIFGVKPNTKNNITFAEDAVVVYPAGRFVAKSFTATKQQEFMIVGEGSRAGEVTAMALSGSRRYCAVAEKAVAAAEEGEVDIPATISIFNVRTLSKRKSLSAKSHANVHEFISICFNLDDTLMLALTGGPTWQLLAFSVDKGRCIAVANVISPAIASAAPHGTSPMPYSCSFSPVSLTKAVVHGRALLTFYSVDDMPGVKPEDEEGDNGVLTHVLAALPGNPTFNSRTAKLNASHNVNALDYTAQSWLGDDLSVVAAASGELLLFKRDQYLRVLDDSPIDGNIIDAIVGFSRGFITGGEGGLVRLFEYSDPEDPTKFSCVKTLHATAFGLDCDDRICSMAISPSEEVAALALSGNQLVALDLAHANVKDDSNAFTPLGPLSHAPPSNTACGPGHRADVCAIIHMDMAVRKPLIATVGVDNSVRIWNYLEKTCEVTKVFPEGPTAVAFHPSGFHILVGFADRLRLLNVLMEDIRDVRDFPIKSCTEVRFSRGGQYFAAVNGNVVQIYTTYTGEYVQTLRGHNGKVTSIQWAYNDATLLSCSTDGSIYEWDMTDAKRARDYFAKGVKWHGVSGVKDCTTVFAIGDGAGADGDSFAVREIDMTTGTVLKEFPFPFPLSSVHYTFANPKMLFVASGGDRTSFVRSYALPLTESPVYADYPACSSAVARMCTSYDDSTLAIAGTDGSLVVYDVRDKDGRLPMSEFAVKVPWSDEVLVTLSDLEDKKTAVRDLRDQVAELQSNNDYAMRMMDIMFQEKLKKITERYTSELEGERQQFDLLREEKLDMEREYTERLNSMEVAHRSEMQKRESLYQGKIMEEVERYQSLQGDVDAQRTMWHNKRNAMVAAHNQYMAQLTNDYERRFEAARDRRHELEDELEGVKRDWEEMRRQMEEDLDKEVEGMKRAYQEKLDAERDATLKYKGENGIMMKKFAALTKEKDEVSEEIKRMTDKQKGLRTQIQDLEKEIQMLRVTIHEKDVNIAEKEKRIYELKKKNQELEKFKFVLDYKIKELKQQIEPRENEIAAMKKQIKEVDAELEAYHKSNAELDSLIGKLRQQLDTLLAQAGKLRTSLLKKEATIKDFSSELHDVVHSAVTPELLVTAVGKLHSIHAEEVEAGSAGNDVSVVHESERQRAHLSTTLEGLKAEAEVQHTAQKTANMTLVEENMNLITQIKGLRDQVNAIKGAQKCWNLDRARAVTLLSTAGVPVPALRPRTMTASKATSPRSLSGTAQSSRHAFGARSSFPSSPLSPLGAERAGATESPRGHTGADGIPLDSFGLVSSQVNLVEQVRSPSSHSAGTRHY